MCTMTETKTCAICGKDKSMEEFPEGRFIESNTEEEVNVCRECV